MAEPVTSLRAWRYPAGTRTVVAGSLFIAAVLTGVAGQSMLEGFAGLAVLMLSAACLAAAIIYLMLDFQGTCTMTTLQLLLPGGRDVPLRRVEDARSDGHHLVLELSAPDETLRIGTQQPNETVAAFARAVLDARGSE